MRRTIAGLVVGVALIALAVSALGLGDVIDVVRAADVWLVALSVVVGTASVVVYGEAFRQLRRRLEPTPFGGRFHVIYYSAQFVRLSLPVGAASFPAILAYVMAREGETSFEENLAVATAADLLGYTTSFLLGFVGFGVFLLTGDGLANGPVLAAAVGAGVVLTVTLGTLAILVYWPWIVDGAVLWSANAIRVTLGRLSDRIHGAVHREAVRERLELFHETIELLRGARRGVVVATTMTVISWVLIVLPLWLNFMAVGQWVPFAVVLFAVPAGNLLGFVPLPGGLGGVELAIGTVVVAAAGVGVQTAAAAVLLHRLATYWVPLLVGGLSSLFVSIEASRVAP